MPRLWDVTDLQMLRKVCQVPKRSNVEGLASHPIHEGLEFHSRNARSKFWRVRRPSPSLLHQYDWNSSPNGQVEESPKATMRTFEFFEEPPLQLCLNDVWHKTLGLPTNPLLRQWSRRASLLIVFRQVVDPSFYVHIRNSFASFNR